MSVVLFDTDIHTDDRRSSKGNQLKWSKGNRWYKADYCGYEGLSEYTISKFLDFSNLRTTEKIEYVDYQTVDISYHAVKYPGCQSKNFLLPGQQLITLERLFHSFCGKSLTEAVFHIKNHTDRLRFIVEQTERITGLHEFGRYMHDMLAIDAITLNEDRHLHNIAVIMDENDRFRYAPVFDNGAGLLSDITMDYPMEMELYSAIDSAKPKTFCDDFTEQLEIAESLYCSDLKFTATHTTFERILEEETLYPLEMKERVLRILLEQRRKYSYLFE